MKLDRTATGFRCTWDNGINIALRRFRETHDTLYAEIEVRNSSPTPFLTEGQMNLSGPRIRQQWADDLEKLHPLGQPKGSPDAWRAMFEELCFTVSRAYRKGEPVQMAGVGGPAKPPEWVLDPIIRKGMVNGLIAPGNSGKSAFAIACALICQLPFVGNPLNLGAPVQPLMFLYLDWETSFEDFDWRVKCTFAGFGEDPQIVPYRHCSGPLARDLEGVSELIEETGVEGVIIDSVGMAAGGDLNKTESALPFLSAIRSLKTRTGTPLTTLLVGHVAKDQDADHPKKKSFYGNAYFGNEARNVWELQPKPSTTETEKIVNLYHNKWNTTFYHQPRALSLSWLESQGIIKWSTAESPDDPEDKKVPLWLRAQRVLGRGPLAFATLRDELGLAPGSSEADSLASTLSRSKRLFAQLDGRWSLLPQEVD